MSEYSAKTLRDARKAKAERMASADPHSKVDSSTWTPPDALNADVKTGMRPLSRRAFKSGGKVEGACGPMRADKTPRKKSGGGIGTSMANKNMKSANEDRDGIKHVGGMKAGGRAGKLSGGALGRYAKAAADDAQMKSYISGSADEQGDRRNATGVKLAALDKLGKKADKRTAGVKMAIDKLSGNAKVNADDRKARKDGGSAYSAADRAKLEAMIREAQKTRELRGAEDFYAGRPGNVEAKDLYSGEQMKRLERGYKKGGRVEKQMGGPMGPDPRLNVVSPTRMKFSGAQGTPYKKGGAAHGDEAMDKALIRKMVKPEARTGRVSGGRLEAYKEKANQDLYFAKKYIKNDKDADKRTKGLAMAEAKTSGSAKVSAGEDKPVTEKQRKNRLKIMDEMKARRDKHYEIMKSTDPKKSPEDKQKYEDAKGKVGYFDEKYTNMRYDLKGPTKKWNPYQLDRDDEKTERNLGASDKNDKSAKFIADYDKARIKREGDAALAASKANAQKLGLKKGGRTQRKDGGKVGKGKTNINIIIGQSKPNQDGPQGLPGAPNMGGMPGMRPPVAPVPMAPAPAPGGMPGMAPGAPAMPPPPMPRKSGGRITKVARSYKDMEAGAGSGEGRLQKTDIASRLPKKKEDGENVYKGLGYPNKVPGATGGRTARKVGGGVYRSYKDMDAGAGSGEGRLEKTAIQRGKRGR